MDDNMFSEFLSGMVQRRQEEKARFSSAYQALTGEIQESYQDLQAKKIARRYAQAAYRNSKKAHMRLQRDFILKLWIARRPEWEWA